MNKEEDAIEIHPTILNLLQLIMPKGNPNKEEVKQEIKNIAEGIEASFEEALDNDKYLTFKGYKIADMETSYNFVLDCLELAFETTNDSVKVDFFYDRVDVVEIRGGELRPTYFYYEGNTPNSIISQINEKLQEIIHGQSIQAESKMPYHLRF